MITGSGPGVPLPPVAPPYDEAMPWTAEDVPDQSGRVAVVTGASSGLGLQTALALARRGARVVLAVRDVEGRGPDAERRIRAEVPDAALEVRRLDLADLDSVRGFAADLPHDGLDLLVNNAGVMALPRRTTRDGFELQFGTNHLGHFALTGLLLPRLLARPAPRVVTVSSIAQRSGRMAWDDLQGERSYRRWGAYGQSKLANALFALELQRRADAVRAPLRSLAAHPGYASTNLQAAAGRMKGNRLEVAATAVMNRVLGQSDAMGALPVLYAATMPDLPGGLYVGPDGAFEARGRPTIVEFSPRAREPESGRRLWAISEELTGVTYAWKAVAAG